MRQSRRVVFASLNRDKFEEFKALLATYPEVELVRAESFLRNPEKLALVETHDTYVENAMAKARLANHGCHYPALADDSGLEIEALNRAPGVRSRRYAQAPGIELSAQEQDRANRELILSELKRVGGGNRRAQFVTHVALMVEGVLLHAEGRLSGSIIDSPRGTHGFGYDPIFVPDGSQKTLAEMNAVEKNAISHRGRALAQLMSQLRSRGIVLAKP